MNEAGLLDQVSGLRGFMGIVAGDWFTVSHPALHYFPTVCEYSQYQQPFPLGISRSSTSPSFVGMASSLLCAATLTEGRPLNSKVSPRFRAACRVSREMRHPALPPHRRGRSAISRSATSELEPTCRSALDERHVRGRQDRAAGQRARSCCLRLTALRLHQQRAPAVF